MTYDNVQMLESLIMWLSESQFLVIYINKKNVINCVYKIIHCNYNSKYGPLDLSTFCGTKKQRKQ